MVYIKLLQELILHDLAMFHRVPLVPGKNVSPVII